MSRMVSLPKAHAARLEELRGILESDGPTPVSRSDAAAYAIAWGMVVALQQRAKGHQLFPHADAEQRIASHRAEIERQRQTRATAASVPAPPPSGSAGVQDAGAPA